MRFYLLFDVQGNAAEQLNNISGQFLNLGSAALQAGSGVESAHGSVIAMIHGLHELATAGSLVREWGEGILETFFRITSSVFDMSAEFESLNARMGFAFGDRQAEVWERVQTYARDSVYTFNEVAGIVGQLGIAIPGVAAEFAEMPERYLSRHGEMIDAFHVLGDTASGTGRNINMIGYEAMQMMSGVYRGAHQVLHLTHQETETIKHAIESTADTAVQFSAIMQVLASHYGGATQAMSHTFSFLRMQIPDLLQILENKIGSAGLVVLTRSLEDVVGWMRELTNSVQFIDSMRGTFAMIAEGVSTAAHWAMTLGTYLRDFIAANPGLVKVGVAVGTIAAAMMVLGGIVLSSAAGLAVFVASVSLAGTTLFTAFGTALAVITAVGGALAGLVTFGAILKGAFDQNLGGIATTFEHIGLLVEGLGEAFHYWEGDTTAITMGMADKLRGAGLLNFFVDLVSWISRGREWMRGFWEGIQQGFTQINWEGLMEGFQAIERALMSVGIAFHLLEPAAGTSFETMQGRGFSFATLINQVLVPALNLLIAGFQFAAWLIESVVFPAMSTFSDVTMTVLNHWSGFVTLAAGVAMYLAPIPTLIFLILNATNGWGAALGMVGTVFSGVLSIAESLLSIVLQLAEGIGSIPSFLGFGGGETEGERRGGGLSMWNPYEHGVPTTVHDGGSTPTDPIEVQSNGGRVDPSTGGGGITPAQLAELLSAAREGSSSGRERHSGGREHPPVIHNQTTVTIDGQEVASIANAEADARRGVIPQVASFPNFSGGRR